MKRDDLKSNHAETEFGERTHHLITLSARSEQAVRQMAHRLSLHLQKKDTPLGDLAYTYHVGRRRFQHRLALTASSRDELLDISSKAAEIEWGRPKSTKSMSYGIAKNNSAAPNVAFLFTGQGSQFSGMGRELYESSTVFKQALDECAQIVQPHFPVPFLDYLFEQKWESELNETHITQPALFALEYALAQLWMSWGVRPALLIGHSLGEYVAACVAGALSLSDALLLVVERGRLMQELCERGGMVSVMATVEAVQPYLQGYEEVVSVSAVNAIDQVVVAGRNEALDELCAKWEQSGVVHKRLPVSHAFHSPLMEPMIERFSERIRQMELKPLNIPLVSNLTGEILQDRVLDATYWSQHLRQPVQFAQGLETLLNEDVAVLIEVGPHPVLKRLADKLATSNQVIVGSLKRGEDAWKAALEHLGQLWVGGMEIDWEAFDADYERARVHLPTYPFEEKLYWIDIDRSGGGAMLDENALSSTASVSAQPLAAAAVQTDFSLATRTQEVVAGYWQEVLGISTLSAEDDFFQLGGDSLNVIQVQTRIQEHFGVSVEFKEFFTYSMLEELAAHLDTLLGNTAGAARGKLQRLPEQEHYELSHAQKRMWYLDQLQPGSPVYNVPNAVRIRGDLQIEVMERSLNEVIARHDALRAKFVTVDGEPVQVIEPERTLTLNVIDLQALPAEEREAEVNRLATEEAQRPFNLEEGPLMRAALVRVNREEHVLLLLMHHIVSDGWSMGVIIRETLALYDAFAAGAASPLPPLAVQYQDFAHWQQEWLQGDELQQQLTYWKQQLAGEVPVLELPTDRPRPSVQTSNGGLLPLALSKTLTEQLEALCKRTGATLNMVLLAAYKTLLHRYSGQEDITVGSPIAGRVRSEVENLIGVFINTLVLRSDLSGDPTFAQLLDRVSKTAMDAYAHADVPFEILADQLVKQRNMSHSPLFQTLFVLQNTPTARMELPGLSFEPLEIDSKTAMFDISVMMFETEQGLTGTFQYNTDLFDQATIQRMIGHFETLLQSIVDHLDLPVSQLPMLSEQERHQLLVEWNDNHVDYPQGELMHQNFELQAERTPDAVAIIDGERRVTYRELNERANQVAHRLQGLGVGPEVFVGVCMTRSLEMIIGMLGILKAGGAYMPMDPNYPQERIGFMLEDTEAPILLSQSDLLHILPEHQAQVLCMDRDQSVFDQEPVTNPTREMTERNLGYVIYTSGSTGKPKGVAIEHRNAATFIQWARGVFTDQELAGVLFSTSICFDLSVFELFVTLAWGGRVIVAENALQLPELPARDEVTLINTVPSAITELLRMDGIPASVRTVNLAGEPLKQVIVDKLYDIPMIEHVYNLYGPSEDTTYSTFARMTANSDRLPTIGRALNNTQVYLLDRHMQPVPIGVPGELHLGGAGLSRGYLKRQELTAEKFIANPFVDDPEARLYKTGDLVRYLPDGNLDYIGRMDHQVKVRGFRIELGEIDARLVKHDTVQESLVIVREDVPGDQRIVAYLVPVAGMEVSTSDLRRYMQDQVPEYMVPSAFVTLEAFPLTPNGKIDRKQLPVPEHFGISNEQEYVAPRTPTEEKLAAMWKDVLNVERVGVMDHFFDLGGHSLLATKLVSRMRREFEVDLPLRSLLETPTVSALAVLIDNKMQMDATQTAAPKLAARSRETRRMKR